jgi:hypothetical protein
MKPIGANRRSRRSPEESGFLTFDEVALFSDALVGGAGVDRSTARHGVAEGYAPKSAERLRLLRLQSAWRRAVGPHLKTVSRPLSCNSSALVVEVRDSAWKRELERAGPEILSRLARLLPDHPIDRILFRLRPAGPHTGSEEARRAWLPAEPIRTDETRPIPADLSVELAPSLERVADTALRERLREVMGRYLGAVR